MRMHRSCLVIAFFHLLFACGPADAYEHHFNEGTNASCSACWAAPLRYNQSVAFIDGCFVQLPCGGGSGEVEISGLGSVRMSLVNGVAEVDIPEGNWSGRYRFQDGTLRTVSGPEPDDSHRAKGMLQRLSRQMSREYLWSSYWYSLPVDTSGKGFWKNDPRWLMWFENPHDPGAMMALVVVLAFGGFLMLGGVWRMHCLLLTALAFALMVPIGSRGGMLALLVGAGAMLLCVLWRRFSGKAVFLSCLALALVAGVVAFLFRDARLIGHLLDLDESNLIRLDMWSSAPRLMFAAPFGWWSLPGFRYNDWFQDLSGTLMSRSLVNSHLTIMAYCGYALSVVYVFLWVALLHSLFVSAIRRGRVLPFGLWLALGVAMFFSPVGLYHWEPWVLPVGALALHIVRSIRERDIGFARYLKRDAVTAVLLVAALAAVGWIGDLRIPDRFRVRKTAGGVKFGSGEARTCILDDGRVLSGGFVGDLGKALRAYAAEHPDMSAVTVAESLDDIPDSVETLVVCGGRCTEYGERMREGKRRPSPKRVYYVSPRLPHRLEADIRRSGGRIRVILGSFLLGRPVASDELPPWLTVVPGAAVYIPDWPRYIGL